MTWWQQLHSSSQRSQVRQGCAVWSAHVYMQNCQQPATSGSAACVNQPRHCAGVQGPADSIVRAAVLLLRIAALDLLASELTDRGLVALSKLPQLRELKLYQAGVTADGLERFAGRPAGAGLRSLVLYGTGALRELSCLGERWRTHAHTKNAAMVVMDMFTCNLHLQNKHDSGTAHRHIVLERCVRLQPLCVPIVLHRHALCDASPR
jgi:hypothetical protein